MFHLFEHRRRFILLGIDSGLAAISYAAAYLIRFEGNLPSDVSFFLLRTIPFLLLIRLACFIGFGLYRGMWASASISDLLAVVKAVSAGSFVFITTLAIIRVQWYSRGVLLLDWLILIMLVGASRLSVRLYREVKPRRGVKFEPVLVIGAGDAGEMVVREMRQNPKLKYAPVGLLDDDTNKHGLQVHGIPVLGPISQVRKFAEDKGADEVIIAIPSADRRRMREIFDVCQQAGLRMKTVPGLGNLLAGTARVSELREIRLEDLLSREPARLDVNLTRQFFAGRRVLVTGAGGSIGSEICRQVAVCDPAVLVLAERGENALFEIDAELGTIFPNLKKVPALADIKHVSKLDELFVEFRPEFVLNAAAFKHVPLMELCPEEAILNNIVGTRRLAEAALRHGVRLFLQISTDKAVNPTNVMGATKRAVERYLQSLAVDSTQQSAVRDQTAALQNGRAAAPQHSQQEENPALHEPSVPRAANSSSPPITNTATSTVFCCVRFGNVLGSSGSVVPTFRKQIERGGPVTVTHPEITRFFMTIPEAVQLVLRAATLAQGGEIFVLDMGTPVKIADMARDLIRLSGLEPGRDIAIVFTGLRPGEKLTEELWYADEAVSPTEQDRLLVVRRQRSDVSGQWSVISDRKSAVSGQQDKEPETRMADPAVPPLGAGSAAKATDPPIDQLPQLLRQLDALERLAQNGASRAALLAALQAVVPEYTPTPS
jgi:FlaA1/EpsC-like NDP-sugar epimerase